LGTPSERVARFAEGLQVIDGLLSEPTTSLHGQYYRLTDAPALPKPVQRPLPLLVGATGPRMLRLAARFAAEWNDWSTPQSYAANSARLDAACEAVGRDPVTVRRSTQAVMMLTSDQSRIDELTARSPLPVVAGTRERISDAVGTWAELGVHELIITDETMGLGDRRQDTLDELSEILFTT
jgi:alkanesulfonate monooxygenase SsuD/methylene tetrahydromethanopterin reductase-like flavin-dependent oxidoreductase (luciferase family)